MIKAKHNIFMYNFIKGYTIWKIGRNFKAVNIIGDVRKSNLPILLLSNHISWWDGFWAMYLNMKIFRRKFHFMMLEDQLKRYWFFKYTGGFSVKKKTRSIKETLSYTQELLSDGKNIVLIFPHGQIQSMHQQNFQFEKGIERAVKNLTGKVQILFMASLVDYFSSPKPAVYIYISDFIGSDLTVKNIQNNYNAFYSQCVEEQKQLIAEM